MPLFRTQLLTTDPRYRYIVQLCNYVFATLFMGMVIVLSGVMLMTYVEQKKQKDEYDEEKLKFAKIFGIILLVGGCLFLLASIVVFVMASIMYVRTRSTPPPQPEAVDPEAPRLATTFSSQQQGAA